jgi:hypothetical protein
LIFIPQLLPPYLYVAMPLHLIQTLAVRQPDFRLFQFNHCEIFPLSYS